MIPHLFLQLPYLYASRVQLPLQFFDFVVQHKLELLQFLILLLQVVYAPIFVPDGNFALVDLALMPSNILTQRLYLVEPVGNNAQRVVKVGVTA